MAQAPATTVRIDPDLKAQANRVFDELGISLSAGVSVFLKAVVREQGMPFEMRLDHMGGLPAYDKIDRDAVLDGLGQRNLRLNNAGIAKKDEFYTCMNDIEAEMPFYKDEFTDKTVFCNCDDPFESNFFRFFLIHFKEYRLKKLVATCYERSSLAGCAYPLCEYLTGFESVRDGAYKAVITHVSDDVLAPEDFETSLVRLFTLPGNSIEMLNGDGDFRSEECLALLDEADIVVTNPPFSLFREFINTLVSKNKQFLILGNVNAATYKEVFPLIRDNRVWFGVSIHSGDRKFYVPDSYPLDASGCGIDSDGRRYIRVKGIRWFTNLKGKQEHAELPLTKRYDPALYPRFDNYDAINVSRTMNIPFDYEGVMGVPITFLDKFNPDQFEILMLANGNVRANADPDVLKEVGYRRHVDDKGGVGVLAGKRAYARVMIRNKHPRRRTHEQ